MRLVVQYKSGGNLERSAERSALYQTMLFTDRRDFFPRALSLTSWQRLRRNGEGRLPEVGLVEEKDTGRVAAQPTEFREEGMQATEGTD